MFGSYYHSVTVICGCIWVTTCSQLNVLDDLSFFRLSVWSACFYFYAEKKREKKEQQLAAGQN